MSEMLNMQQVSKKEPKRTLETLPLPERPFQCVWVGLFEYCGHVYVLCVDYYSHILEIRKLQCKTTRAVKSSLLAIFAVHGLPEETIADNMPFNSKEFKQFGKQRNIKFTTTSATMSNSYRLAKRHVQIVKKILKKATEEGKDEHIALLEHRNTPFTGCDYSPAQLLFGRQFRGKLPVKVSNLDPKIPINAHDQLLKYQASQKFYYDRNATLLKPLHQCDTVGFWREKTWEPVVVIRRHKTPCS